MTTTEKPNGRVEISTDSAHILHRIGSDYYTENRTASVPIADLPNWEEIAVSDIPAYTQEAYETKVNELIRRRYSVSQELAILRQREAKPEEFAAYNAYAEACKAEARELLGN